MFVRVAGCEYGCDSVCRDVCLWVGMGWWGGACGGVYGCLCEQGVLVSVCAWGIYMCA